MEVSDLRSDTSGYSPEELPRARAKLEAEMGSSARSREGSGLRRRGLIFGGVAVGAAAALTVGLLSVPRGAGGQGSVATLTVKRVLAKAAAAAGSQRVPVPRPDQFIYLSTASTYGTRQQIWRSADEHRTWLIHTTNPGGGTGNWDSYLPTCGTGLVRGSYEWMKTLPTDPSALRSWIYAHKNGGNPPDQQAMIDITDMLRSALLPPGLARALFEVMATIPGMTVTPNVRDAAGRLGVAVGGEQQAIFDPKSYKLLGERTVVNGKVTDSTAVLTVKVVDRTLPGKIRPARTGNGRIVTCMP